MDISFGKAHVEIFFSNFLIIFSLKIVSFHKATCHGSYIGIDGDGPWMGAHGSIWGSKHSLQTCHASGLACPRIETCIEPP